VAYVSTSTGHVTVPATDLCSKCEGSTCVLKDSKVLCLHFDRKLTQTYPLVFRF
jgi:hypothetical protein